MKKLLMLAVAALLFDGCQTAYIKTPEWEAKISSHMFKRDVDKLAVQRQLDGSYSIDLNGYKGDVSEQFPIWTREMWQGLGIIGRIAATAVNPAAAGVPLTSEAANAADVASLVKANADLKAQLAQAKAAAKAGAKADCPDGKCGE